ncbi:ataxin-1 [Platysternon megacephalum]|uniref:Ataxin-1 n=1 Tax=Platysternon megacephalum TaxID=55544 RepID=A0A4D9EUC9_9SAUR|nr:ataxin-1 [Platysternon megacephalum]
MGPEGMLSICDRRTQLHSVHELLLGPFRSSEINQLSKAAVAMTARVIVTLQVCKMNCRGEMILQFSLSQNSHSDQWNSCLTEDSRCVLGPKTYLKTFPKVNYSPHF